MVPVGGASKDGSSAASCRIPEGAGVAGATGPWNDMCASVSFEHVVAVGIAAATDAVSFGSNTAEVICPGVTWQGSMHSSGLQEIGGGMPSIVADGCNVAVVLVNPSPGSS